MCFVSLSALKDLWRARRDPLSFATWIGIPLILVLMLNLVFGGSNAPLPKGRLLICDEDRSFASGIVTGAFNREPLDKMFLIERVDRREGRARIDRGEASAFLFIPKGLQQAFLHSQPYHLQLFVNPSQRISPQIVEEALSTIVEGGFYVQRVASTELLDADFGAVYRRVMSMRKGMDPPLIDLQTEVIQVKKQTKSTAALFFPTMLFMAIWMLASAQAADVWKERASGVLRRLAVAPMRIEAFLAGRLVFVLSLFAAIALAGLAAARWLGGVPVANLPVAAVWAALCGAAFYLVMMLLTMLASNEHAAHVLVNLVAFPMALVGGCFFPLEIMPSWMAAIGRLTPPGWAVTQFSDIVSGTATPRTMAIGLAALVGASGLAFLLARRRLSGSFAI